MKYRPYWQRIIILAVVFNIVLMLTSSSVWSVPENKEQPPEDLQEIEWVETEETTSAEPILEVPPVETFPEIVFPPLEIPHTEFPPLPELKIEPPPPPPQPKPVEKPPETESKPVEKPAEKQPEENKATDTVGKLKVIVKVYPKDLIDQLIASGAVKEKVTLNGGKIVLAVTITTEGKVRNVEIRRGGGNDERGNLINLVSEIAAQSWIFEPFRDENGNPKELKTQIEFKPEDF